MDIYFSVYICYFIWYGIELYRDMLIHVFLLSERIFLTIGNIQKSIRVFVTVVDLPDN